MEFVSHVFTIFVQLLRLHPCVMPELAINDVTWQRSLGTRRPRRWEDNIRMDLRRKGGKVWTGFNWL